MAVLRTKTMGPLNEERKPVYPLFQKPSKAIKSENKTTLPLQQSIDETPVDEPIPKKGAVPASKKPQKPAKNDLKPLPSSNVSSLIPSADSAKLLDVDPNNHRRKRQKTTLPNDEKSEATKSVLPVSPVAQRQLRQGAPCSNKATDISEGEGLVTKPIEYTSENNLGKTVPNLQEQESSIPNLPGIGTFKSVEPSEGEANGRQTPSKRQSPANVSSIIIVEDEPESKAIDAPIENLDESKTKKILRFDPKTGTIGSPPAKKNASSIEAIKNSQPNRRAKQPKSKLVTICYGQREALGSSIPIGPQIDQILKGTRRIEPSPKKKAPLTSRLAEPVKPTTPKKTKPPAAITSKPPAALHPFFSGKPLSKSSDAKETAKENATTGLQDQESRSLGRARRGSRGKLPSPSKPHPSAFTGFPGLGLGAKIMKFPGAIEPAWPWKDMVHIRGNAILPNDARVLVKDILKDQTKAKKSKYVAIEILAEEDTIRTLAADLGIDQALRSIREINQEDYPQLPSCLRVPIKHFESGYQLQKRVRKELHVRGPQPNITNDEVSSGDEIQEKGTSRTHPAVSKVYGLIATTLTAFDQFRYETQPWAHKYAPICAAEVLQTGREAVILKEWLQNLTVLSVETGSSDRPNSRASSVSRRSAGTSKSDLPGKRKRKSKKLDGFVISDGEGEDDMDEISEPEEDDSPRGSQSLFQKTVIRQGDAAAKGSKEIPRLANAVVISGPHGCGKTAAVYAVARELGFEVFEINSSSRRSGKDILEKVGDMTRNHLVHQSHGQVLSEPLDEDAQRISDALADDIKSGRQGTVNSFFKPKDATKSKPKPKISKPTAKASESVQASLFPKAPPKQQKQSLILFEEVDVLYEEDKQFWTTVMTLIDQSKRPIIITCQDESALPLQSLKLHAILRFTPPPVDLATDYMLLVAANEGHALQRNAVKSLYRSRHFDLRASITELNFWCQFAVGDVKGGLDWLLPRWPLGSDVDKDGNKIRVVSEKTYVAGMGWLSQDFLESHMHYLDIEEETLHEAWDGWRLDLGHWERSIDMAGWANKPQAPSGGSADNRARLNIYEDFTDAMSMADLNSGSTFAPDNRIQLDPSIPELSDTVREDYLLDRPLLEATSLIDFNNTGPDIAFWMKSRARKYLQVDQHVENGLEVPSELDRPSEAHIIGLVENQISSPEFALTRQDLSRAFDPISEPEQNYVWSTVQLEASVFDRTKSIITTDLAPYVRSIVSYDAKLQQERARMSNLLSEGGKKVKRMRTTRAAMSALEGGARSTTRRDRYFCPDLNPYLVLKTGMPSWLEALSSDAAAKTTATIPSTALSTGDSDLSKVEMGDGKEDLSEDSL